MHRISIIIITYNRPQDTLALLQDISRLEHMELLQSVVLLNNQSTEDYRMVEQYIIDKPEVPFIYKIASQNLGVAAGRNYAAQFSTAEILLFLDDDILLPDIYTLTKVCQSFEQNSSTRPIGVISYKVLYHETGTLQRTAFPHKKFNSYKSKHLFETSYYAGCAHAKLRKALLAAGPYPKDFFYGMEEYDYSYRIIEKKYSILYNDLVCVIHKESPLGRKTKSEKIKMMWVNKTKVSYRYLPRKYVISTTILWAIYFLYKSKMDLKMFFKGIDEINKIRIHDKRTLISSYSLIYLKKVNARLWY